MKKYLLLICPALTLLPIQSFAKTSGNYVGIDYINTELAYQKTITPLSEFTSKSWARDNGRNRSDSVSINYKYAFNLKPLGMSSFYIAPTLFFDNSNTYIISQPFNGQDHTYRLRYRYGSKVDFGYDITKRFSLFINAGLVNNFSIVNYRGGEGGIKAKHVDINPIYGLGMKYSLLRNLDINLSYDQSKVTMKSPLVPAFIGTEYYTENTHIFKIKTIKLGLAYKF